MGENVQTQYTPFPSVTQEPNNRSWQPEYVEMASAKSRLMSVHPLS